MGERVIFHVDANSAFLSWSAVYRMQVLGDTLDLRTVPAVVAGDKASRHSIILAKSLPAKRFGIQTGEPLFQALEKCPQLQIVQPDYNVYVETSRHFVALLKTFSPHVEQYSIDEAWVDMTGTRRMFGDPVMAAEAMRRRINEELQFTVNIGISSNKLLAKTAGDFEKPNKIHTLFPAEIPEKMWVLPVRDLFFVGHATEKKLHQLGIYTIGDLAHTDPGILRRRFGKVGSTLWSFANGRNGDNVEAVPRDNKGYGNAVTTSRDVTDRQVGHQVLLSLCETVAMRLRKDEKCGSVIAVHLRTSGFEHFSHQSVLPNATNITERIYTEACRVFDEAWNGSVPLRQLGVQMSGIVSEPYQQYDFLSDLTPAAYDRKMRLDEAVDGLRDKFGEDIIRRAKFASSDREHMAGGLSRARRTGITKPIPPEVPEDVHGEK